VRVLFTPWAQPTHYYHMVPLVWALRAAGHEVRVAGQPRVVEAVKRSGLTVTTVGTGYDHVSGFQQIVADFRRGPAGSPTPPAQTPAAGAPGEPPAPATPAVPVAPGDAAAAPEDPFAAKKRILNEKFGPFVHSAEAMAEDLLDLAKHWPPDLIVADPFVLAAPLVARTSGATLLHHLWGPAVIRPAGIFPGSGAPPAVWPDDLHRLYDRYGVAAAPEYATGSLDACPDRLQYPGVPGRLPMRFVPYNGAGDHPAWLSTPPERRRICVSWGTNTTQMVGAAGFLVPEILAVLAPLDAEIVVTVKRSDRALLGEVPPGVRVLEEMPLHLLLPGCDAIVHQGGAGTLLTAASAGVPQVVIAGIMDQIANAGQVAAAGVGVAINAVEPPPEGVLAAVAAGISRVLLEDGVRESARLLQEEIAAQPTPAATVTALEELVGSGASRA
jgi:UDP:flavonoid glycosyltransferase YjiC (YdhE family)